jgi:hypothetical protein
MSRSLYIVDPASILYTIDPATASTHQVGPVGIAQVTDIAFHGPTLYGITFAQFLRLNPDTGTGVVVGATGFSANGLAVASDGTIYAAAGNQLIKIDPATGAGQVVGPFGGNLTSSGDLAFDSNDVLYGALNSGATVVLAQVNRANGHAAPIGPTGFSTVYGLAFYCCRLYGITSAGELLDINVGSGKAAVIAKNTLTPWGMAARPCCGC